MSAVLHPAKIYLSLYAEAEGFAHLHVHLIPRAVQTPIERRGPGIFEYLRESKTNGRNLVNLEDVEHTVEALRQALRVSGDA
jgi:diadenosine tetraphosphate (Ap4A) HIT family hydrolase